MRRCWSTRRAAGCSASGRRTGRPIRRARPMARLYDRDPDAGLAAARLGARLIAADLHRARHQRRLPAARRCAGQRRRPGDRRPRLWRRRRTRSRPSPRAVAEGLADGRRAAGAQAHPRPRPRQRRQPPKAAGGARRPRNARGHRLRRIPSPEKIAVGDDRACGVSRAIDPVRPATTSATMVARSDSRLHRIRRAC